MFECVRHRHEDKVPGDHVVPRGDGFGIHQLQRVPEPMLRYVHGVDGVGSVLGKLRRRDQDEVQVEDVVVPHDRAPRPNINLVQRVPSPVHQELRQLARLGHVHRELRHRHENQIPVDHVVSRGNGF